MIPALVFIGIFCALYWALMAGHELAPKVSIRRRPKPEPERLMPAWEVLELERECEVGNVTTDDIVNAVWDALDTPGTSIEELDRLLDAQHRVFAEKRREFDADLAERIARLTKRMERR